MTAADPSIGTRDRPLRVSVVGSSVTYMAVPRGDRDEGPFGEVLPRVLANRGVVAEVAHVSTWFGLIHQLRHRYPELRDQHADVVVVAYGMGEAQPRTIPTWLMGHLTTWDVGTWWPARPYRAHVVPRVWRALRALQRRVAAWDRRLTHRLSPTRFAMEMRALVQRLRTELGTHVLVLDLDPVGSKVLHFVPSQGERAARFNAVLASTIAAIDDPEVVLVENSRTVPPDLVDDLLPDGFHRSPAGHRLTAELLADHITDWLARRRHAATSAEVLS